MSRNAIANFVLFGGESGGREEVWSVGEDNFNLLLKKGVWKKKHKLVSCFFIENYFAENSQFERSMFSDVLRGSAGNKVDNQFYVHINRYWIN